MEDSVLRACYVSIPLDGAFCYVNGRISLKDHETFFLDFTGALYSNSQHSTKQPESQLKIEKFLKRKNVLETY